MDKDLEKRIENLEKIIRENFGSLGIIKSTVVEAHPNENNPNGGDIAIFCGSCSKSLGTCYGGNPPTGINYCPQCGMKVELGKDFTNAQTLLKHAKEIYDKTAPLKKEIEILSTKKKP